MIWSRIIYHHFSRHWIFLISWVIMIKWSNRWNELLLWWQNILGAHLWNMVPQHIKPPSHRTATTLRPWRPRDSTRSPCGRQISEKKSPRTDRAALARRSDARPLWAQLRFHYDLCVSATRSYHNLTAPWALAQCDHRRPCSDATMT